MLANWNPETDGELPVMMESEGDEQGEGGHKRAQSEGAYGRRQDSADVEDVQETETATVEDSQQAADADTLETPGQSSKAPS